MSKYIIDYWYFEGEEMKQGQHEIEAKSESEALEQVQKWHKNNCFAFDVGLTDLTNS